MDCYGIDFIIREIVVVGLLYGMEDIVDYIVNGVCGGFIFGMKEFVFFGLVIKIVFDEFFEMVSFFYMFLCLSVNNYL